MTRGQVFVPAAILLTGVLLASSDALAQEKGTPAPQGPEISAGQQATIDSYLSELKRVQGAQRTSMEKLFGAAHNVRELLMNPPREGDDQPHDLGELSDETVKRIDDRLIGLSLSTADWISVDLDGEYLLDIARAHGTPTDIEFFAIRNRAYAVSGWKVWIRQLVMESGCVDFTSGELVDVYAAWRRFQALHPRKYVSAVDEEVSDMQDNLLAGDRRLCEEQDRRLVARELMRLLTLLPQDPIAPKIRERLREFAR